MYKNTSDIDSCIIDSILDLASGTIRKVLDSTKKEGTIAYNFTKDIETERSEEI